MVPGALPAGTGAGRGQGQAAEARLSGNKGQERRGGKSLIKDGAISTGSGKARQRCQNLYVKVWGCNDVSSSGRVVPSQPDASRGFDVKDAVSPSLPRMGD